MFGKDGYGDGMLNKYIGKGSFLFKKISKVDGKDTSVYFNKETGARIQQKHVRKHKGNLWILK